MTRSIRSLLMLSLLCVSTVFSSKEYCGEVCEKCEQNITIPTNAKICKFLSYTDPATGFKICIDLQQKPELYYARSVQRFSENPDDQWIYVQSIWDLTSAINYQDSLQSKLGIRNKARWGSPAIINTTEETIKAGDAVTGKHRHYIGRQFMWIREAWVQISLNEAIGLPTCNEHYFKIGAFSFKLGRGISLGDAYAVSPGVVGFYVDDVVDQYAYGLSEHGEVIHCRLSYDFYYEMARNRSGSFSEVAEAVYAQDPSRYSCPSRGFGSITQLVAFKFDYHPFDPESSCGYLNMQPYVLGAYAPEQRVEVQPDAFMQMGTWGCAFDYTRRNFVWGGELAFNRGAQTVRPLDRNQIKEVRNSDGFLVNQYTQVYTDAALTTKALVSDANKVIVDADNGSPVSNGTEIGSTGLYNGLKRYRPKYKNHLGGFMAITDFGWTVCNENIKLVGTLAYASGDQDPNKNLVDPLDSREDNTYNGFVGLQEVYAGKQVQSVFVIGSHRISRPLSTPSEGVPQIERFASTTSGFTNLMIAGFGVHWMPQTCTTRFNMRPNLIAYWNATASNKFDITTGQTIDEPASKFLGAEFNLFFDFRLLKETIKVFGVGAAFFPGQHYKDVLGKPQSADEAARLAKNIKNGNPADTNLLLGDSMALAFNIGFEYAF
ncbi:hypothetical protein HOM50_04385 [bacterium]|jgi:hypothetical protein|nr:hypothetical protein [bacterium]MBT5015617.1 hypothetical protein [bacterium]